MKPRPLIVEWCEHIMDIDEHDYIPLEEKLNRLSSYTRLEQLELLIAEIDHFLDHAIQPDTIWFERRIDYVIMYSSINWADLAEQTFDRHLHCLAQTVTRCSQQIMEDWSVGPVYDLGDYYTMLHTVNEARIYFNTHYMIPNHDDGELFDVMAGIANL